MIPLLHDFADTRVLIFGGGPVARRKARRFSREATVLVVSPTFVEGFPAVELIRAAPEPSDIADWLRRVEPALVIAATDQPAVNEAIETAASEQGRLYNRADHSGARSPMNVAVPATVRDGTVLVAVSTNGTAPAVSAAIRDRITPVIDGTGELAAAIAAVRTELKRQDIPAERRRDLLRAVLDEPAVWKDLGRGIENTRQTVDSAIDRLQEKR